MEQNNFKRIQHSSGVDIINTSLIESIREFMTSRRDGITGKISRGLRIVIQGGRQIELMWDTDTFGAWEAKRLRAEALENLTGIKEENVEQQ